MTKNKTVVRSIRFSEETNQLLKVESHRLGVSQNDLIRIGLRSIKNAELQTLKAAKELLAS